MIKCNMARTKPGFSVEDNGIAKLASITNRVSGQSVITKISDCQALKIWRHGSEMDMGAVLFRTRTVTGVHNFVCRS